MSGCACAAELVGLGCEVVLVNSGMDSVGYPGYGPEVAAPDESHCFGGWRTLYRAFMAVPETVRRAWLAGSLACSIEWPLLVIDRRAVALNTKWALEQLDGLRLRQGLVTAIREVPAEAGASVEVDTVFGETLCADACVLAVGLALGGVVQTGAYRTGGGRYAEVPANDLHECLLKRDVPLQRAEAAVGARWRASAATSGLECGAVPLRPLQSLSAALERDGGWDRVELEPWDKLSHPLHAGPEALGVLEVDARVWRDALGVQAAQAEALESVLKAETAYLPPSPYDRERRDTPAARPPGSCFVRGHATSAGRRDWHMGLFAPDGLATAEWYATPGEMDGRSYADGLVHAGWTISRPAHVITSWVIGRADPGGVVKGFRRTWACGQAGGSLSYLESLASGGAVARAVASELG